VLEILHADEHLLVVNKPTDVSLLADRSGEACLWDHLHSMCDKPYLVHRLDKGTSGVLAVALDAATQKHLTQAFARRLPSKYYVARVAGELRSNGTLTIDLPLRRGRKSRYRVAGLRSDIRSHEGGWDISSSEGHPSCTRLRTIRCSEGTTTLLLKPITGRTHQLRVHLSWVGYPVLGDTLYARPGSAQQHSPRMMLHAHKLVLPDFGVFTAPVHRSFFTSR
jgi:RluA family pseudouridine synthase|tara:strand:- start:2427 stop:3092 length:666 start_codon:yes stop_codon:yes gene_type:complete